MKIADFFVAVNAAGIRLAAVDGQLELRGEITPEIQAGAAEHKAVILSMLQPADEISEDEAERVYQTVQQLFPKEVSEADAIAAEGQGLVDAAVAAKIGEDFDKMVLEDGYRSGHDWRDWRLEWMLHVGQLSLRLRNCTDTEVLAILKPLADATPTTKADWLVLGRRVLDAEDQLRQQKKLPNYHWPAG